MVWPFGKIFGRESKDTVEVSLDEFFRLVSGSSVSKSGVVVNVNTALKVSTVFACCRRLAEAVTVPCKVYVREENGRRNELRTHPLSNIFSGAPNDRQSWLEYRETLAYHLAIYQNAYSLIGRVRGEIDELTPLLPQNISPKTDKTGKILSYSYTNPAGGGKVEFGPDDIWHLRGPSWSAATGLDTLTYLREAISLAIASEETHSNLHKNGMMPSGLVAVKQKLTETQLVRLAAYVQAHFGGSSNIGKVVTLDGEADFKKFGMSGVDAEHLETRRFQCEDICRGMGVLPIMVGITDKATTYASAEQMFLAHLVHTVRPSHDRWTSSIDRWLLSDRERKSGVYTAFVESAFLSPAMKDKAEYRKTALGGSGSPGWLTPNEVRAHDELPPKEGGDNLYSPTNTGPIDEKGIPQVPKKEQPNAPDPANSNN